MIAKLCVHGIVCVCTIILLKRAINGTVSAKDFILISNSAVFEHFLQVLVK